MNETQVRDLLLKKAQSHARRKGSLGMRAWAEAHGIPPSRVSEFLAGKRLPNPAILDALGLEWRIVRKARGQ